MFILKYLKNQHGDTMMVMMTTLNMLLLAFFIVLNSFAVPDDSKQLKAWGSMLGTLGLLSKGLNPGKDSGTSMFPPTSEFMAGTVGITSLLESLERFSKEQSVDDQISVEKSREGIKIFMTSQILFDPGNAKLTPFAKVLLKKTALILSKIDGDIVVSGHTSPASFRNGPYPNDWVLSWARAGSASREMLKTKLFKPKRLSISGYSFIRPVMGGGTKVRDRLNDRLEIALIRKRGV